MDHSPMNAKRIIAIIGYVALLAFLFTITLRQAHAADVNQLEKRMQEQEDRISIVLAGVTDYAATELFNDLVENAPGVVDARRFRFSLYPDDPAKCWIEWQVLMGKARPFELESHIYSELQKIAHGTGDDKALSLSLRPTAEHRELLGRIRPWHATSRKLSFRMLHLPTNHGNENPDGIHAARWPDRGFD